MSDGIDKKFIKDYYSRMSDEDLIRETTQQAYNLTPEAYEVIDEVLRSRNLDKQVHSAVEAQKKEYTPDEIDEYCKILQYLKCPVCGSSQNKLNGTLISETVSFLIVTTSYKKIIIGCPDCLDKESAKARDKTLMLGWWGFPWGPIRSAQSLNINSDSKRFHRIDKPNHHLQSFTLSKIGEIEMYKNNKEKLQNLIEV